MTSFRDSLRLNLVSKQGVLSHQRLSNTTTHCTVLLGVRLIRRTGVLFSYKSPGGLAVISVLIQSLLRIRLTISFSPIRVWS